MIRKEKRDGNTLAYRGQSAGAPLLGWVLILGVLGPWAWFGMEVDSRLCIYLPFALLGILLILAGRWTRATVDRARNCLVAERGEWLKTTSKTKISLGSIESIKASDLSLKTTVWAVTKGGNEVKILETNDKIGRLSHWWGAVSAEEAGREIAEFIGVKLAQGAEEKSGVGVAGARGGGLRRNQS